MASGKNKGTAHKNDYTKKCQDGNLCTYQLGYRDVPNKFGDLKFRAVCTLASFIILQFNQTAGNYFFTGLLMFSVPMYYDNLKFSPVEPGRKVIKFFSLLFLGLHIFIGCLGVAGIINCIDVGGELIVQVSNKNLVFKDLQFELVNLWWSIGAEVLLTVADTIVAQATFVKSKFSSQYA